MHVKLMPNTPSEDHRDGYHMQKTVGAAQPWHWNYCSNGRPIFRSSENYRDRDSCRRGIEIAQGSAAATVYDEEGQAENQGLLSAFTRPSAPHR